MHDRIENPANRAGFFIENHKDATRIFFMLCWPVMPFEAAFEISDSIFTLLMQYRAARCAALVMAGKSGQAWLIAIIKMIK
jgi:hypothetical protein